MDHGVFTLAPDFLPVDVKQIWYRDKCGADRPENCKCVVHAHVLVEGYAYNCHATCRNISDQCNTCKGGRSVHLVAINDVLVRGNKYAEYAVPEENACDKRRPD